MPFISRAGSNVAGRIRAFRHHIIIAKHCADGRSFGMHIPHPYQAIALDAIPQVILHVEVHSVSTRHPYFVQQGITAVERAEVGNIPEHKNGAHFL